MKPELKVVPQPAAKKPLRPMFIYTLNMSSWQARGKDEEVTREAKQRANVADSEDVGSFSKKFLKCPELDKVHSVLGATRNGFYLRSRPWGEVKQMRCGLVQFHIEMKQYVGDMQEELERAKNELRPVYTQRVEEERFKLAGMFKESDYPSVDEVMSKFSIKLYTTTLNDPNDFRVLTDIPPAERDALIEETKKQLEVTVKGAAKDALSRLYPVVANMAVRLKEYDAKQEGERRMIHGSLVENVRIMAEFARRLNLEDDPDVNKFAAEAERLVEGVSAKDLKDSQGQRALVKTQAEQLAERMNKYFGSK